METPNDESSDSKPNDDPIPFAKVLLATPLGALILATLGSIPAAALTVGVQNWNDLARRAPWWVIGVVITLIALGAALVISVHPRGRRLATWTLGWFLAIPSALFVCLFTWLVVFDRESVDDWWSWTIAQLFFVVLTVVGLLVVRRRVRDGDDPRLLRSAEAAKGFLIPPDDPSTAIIARLDELSEELRQIRTENIADHSGTTWNGPAWLGRLAARRGWLNSLDSN